MKTVHLISGRDAGGARTHVLRLLGELNKTEETPLLCLSSGALSEAAEKQGLPCTVLSGSFSAQLRAARSFLRGGGFDVVHCHGSRANLTGALLSRTLGVPVVSTIHSDHRLDYLRRPLARLTYGTLNALALRRMDALVCVSDAMRERYAARGFRRAKLFSIYNGVDMEALPPRIDRAAWLAAHGISAQPGDILAGTAARFDPVKDLPTMLRGFAAAAREEPRLRLILAGTGAEEARLRALAETLGVKERVFFPGWVEDTDGLYQCMDICLLTSLSETFPYALTDAAKYGVPVIATAVGGVPALVEHGVTGALIAPGDAATLAENLLALARDGAQRARLGAALHDRTAKEFSLRAMAERMRYIDRAVTTPRREIVISGAYGCGNRGDELMLEAILRDVRAIAPESAVTVLSHRPGETARRFDADALWYLDLAAAARRLKRSRLLISGGGNLLQDATSRRSLAYYLALLRLAGRCGGRVLLTGAGLGPLSGRGWRKTAKALNECADAAVFREEASLAAARAHGVSVPALRLGLDPALETPVSDVPREDVLLFCPRRVRGGKKALEAMADAAADYAAKRGWRLCFLAMNVRQDAPLCRALAGRTGGVSLDAPEDTASLVRLFALARGTVTLRLHALALSYLTQTPLVGIDADGRIAALARELSLCTVAAAAPEALPAALRSALEAPPPVPALPEERRNAARETFERLWNNGKEPDL